MPKAHSEGDSLDAFLERLEERTPGESEFHQAVSEVLQDVHPLVCEERRYRDAKLLERLTEPERTIVFRVDWETDEGEIRVNRGYRVQFNGAIGPYKGGLRFHPQVNLGVLKFLGFEQTFKNALTGLPMGGGKGGADFDPTGCSEREIMRFCQAFMAELHRHIGPDIDVPAGDINVGAREIGYLFGAYRRLRNEFEGVLTGKGLCFSGSEMRTEATGYGLVYMLENVLDAHDLALEDATVCVSGAGNVATHAAEKAIELGAKVLTLSDSQGFVHAPEGLGQEQIDWVREHKMARGEDLSGLAETCDAEWHEGEAPWQVECDIALPCATQNELDEDAARALVENGCKVVAEGANMPLTGDARAAVRDGGLVYVPGKAGNAGGVALSGLEISQNAMRRSRDREELDRELREIMEHIHRICAEAGGREDDVVDYARGANIAGFRRVAEAMVAQGV